ncbi:MAG: response regulator transcription factor [Leptolyngbyaceae cyanobacterium]
MTTILIVDDSQTLRKMLKDYLTSNGMQVLEATNGKEAKQQITSASPDLVITDLIMPEMNGYELCRWLKNETALKKKVPILICSTKSEEFDRYWGMKQGADAYLTKPFEEAELLQTVRKLLKSVA